MVLEGEDDHAFLSVVLGGAAFLSAAVVVLMLMMAFDALPVRSKDAAEEQDPPAMPAIGSNPDLVPSAELPAPDNASPLLAQVAADAGPPPA